MKTQLSSTHPRADGKSGQVSSSIKRSKQHSAKQLKSEVGARARPHVEGAVIVFPNPFEIWRLPENWIMQ